MRRLANQQHVVYTHAHAGRPVTRLREGEVFE